MPERSHIEVNERRRFMYVSSTYVIFSGNKFASMNILTPTTMTYRLLVLLIMCYCLALQCKGQEDPNCSLSPPPTAEEVQPVESVQSPGPQAGSAKAQIVYPGQITKPQCEMNALCRPYVNCTAAFFSTLPVDGICQWDGFEPYVCCPIKDGALLKVQSTEQCARWMRPIKAIRREKRSAPAVGQQIYIDGSNIDTLTENNANAGVNNVNFGNEAAIRDQDSSELGNAEWNSSSDSGSPGEIPTSDIDYSYRYGVEQPLSTSNSNFEDGNNSQNSDNATTIFVQDANTDYVHNISDLEQGDFDTGVFHAVGGAPVDNREDWPFMKPGNISHFDSGGKNDTLTTAYGSPIPENDTQMDSVYDIGNSDQTDVQFSVGGRPVRQREDWPFMDKRDTLTADDGTATYDNNGETQPEFNFTPKPAQQTFHAGAVGATHVSNVEDWPFMAAIFEIINSDRIKVFLCGGSLIARDTVLTAAHCFITRDDSVRTYSVRFGSLALMTTASQPVVEFETQQLIVHPHFRPPSLYNDIALLKFSIHQNLQYTPIFRPICLPDAEERDNEYRNTRLITMGWGSQSYGGALSSVLQEVEVPVVDKAPCNAIYGKLYATRNNYGHGLDETIICAGNTEEQKDACQGDSGGPLISVDQNFLPRIVGIVSSGLGCGTIGIPGIYTRVDRYMEWIEANLQH